MTVLFSVLECPFWFAFFFLAALVDSMEGRLQDFLNFFVPPCLVSATAL